jgi:hypothetical protein
MHVVHVAHGAKKHPHEVEFLVVEILVSQIGGRNMHSKAFEIGFKCAEKSWKYATKKVQKQQNKLQKAPVLIWKILRFWLNIWGVKYYNK